MEGGAEQQGHHGQQHRENGQAYPPGRGQHAEGDHVPDVPQQEGGHTGHQAEHDEHVAQQAEGQPRHHPPAEGGGGGQRAPKGQREAEAGARPLDEGGDPAPGPALDGQIQRVEHPQHHHAAQDGGDKVRHGGFLLSLIE